MKSLRVLGRVGWLLLVLVACSPEDGAPGSAGAVGADGVDGQNGADGQDGVDGQNGSDGADGADGTNGTDGDDGENGTNGTNGGKGADGADAAPRPVGLSLSFLGRYESEVFDEGAAEIVAFDRDTGRVFVVNASAATVDVLDVTDPTEPSLIDSIEVTGDDATLGAANSVAVKDGVVAVAVEAAPKTDPGIVAFYDTETLDLLGTAQVGALPDMLTFTPDGSKVLVANEGEPSDDYTQDPEGSVSIVTVPANFSSALTVQTAGFAAFDADATALRDAGVRLYGPNATVAQDLEPEYLTVSADGSTAWVTLQENNALGVIDVATATVTAILPLGYKNHALLGNELDASDQDGAIAIRNWPVFGMYQPDAIASYEAGGQTYLVTVNEGDVREYDTFEENVRLGNGAYVLDPTVFPDAAELKANSALGRLNVTNQTGDSDGDGDFDAIYAFGARSFSVWSDTGSLLYDSGSEIELRTALREPAHFNASHTSNAFENRSDDKGPEPEALTIATIEGTPFAFIGLERIGGIMVYDLSLPENPRFVSYVNSRDFASAFPDAGDLGPESSVYVPAEDSPSGSALLIVGNEVSGTTAIFSVAPLYGALP